MAIKRINFTNRRRIHRRDARIEIRQDAESVASFDVDLRLDSYSLPNDGLVFVEAYRQTSWMRFPWGTVDCLSQPDDRRLVEFGQPEGIYFRVRVTSPEKPRGLLLAQADGIRPTDSSVPDDQGRVPLLPVRPGEDLDDEVYRLDLESRPVLVINKTLGDWRAVARDDVFQALVYPSILREVLTLVHRIEGCALDDDDEDWRGQWLRFARGFSQARDLSEEEWITEVVESFARRSRLVDKVKPYLER